MAYTINKTDGERFATVADGTVNTDSSLVMVGKNYAGYGESLNENFFRLLESNANATPPATPQQGQLWFDTGLGLLKVWNTAEWKDLGSSAAGVTGPADPVAGDQWYDTVNSQLNVYDGNTYVLIGPSYSAGTGTTGNLVETVSDGVLDYVIIKVIVNDATVAIIAKDVSFTPVPPISGFTSIKPGYNLSTDNLSGPSTVPLFIGDATNAELLNNIPSTDFLSSVSNDSTSGTLAIVNGGGLSIGLLGEAQISVDGFSTITFENNEDDSDIVFSVAPGGAPTSVITIDGTTARAEVATPLAGTDIANMDYVDTSVTNGTVASTNALESATTTVDVSTAIAPTNGQFLRATSGTAAEWQTVSTNGETPIGGIIMYSGTVSAIPANWSLCDGSGGTPDLVNTFVYGTVTEGEIGDTGGTANAVNISHSHTFTGNPLDAHRHAQSPQTTLASPNTWTSDPTSGSPSGTLGGWTNYVSGGTPSGSISTTGANGTGLNIPPYVKLAYIMRIS